MLRQTNLFETGDRRHATITDIVGCPAAVVACDASALGHPEVVFAGHVGWDDDGAMALEQLRAAGVGIGPLARTRRSARAVVTIQPDGRRTVTTDPGDPDWSFTQMKLDGDELVYCEAGPLLDRGDAYGRVVAEAHASGARVAIDVGSAGPDADIELLREAIEELRPDILLANAAEAAGLRLEAGLARELYVVHSGRGATQAWVHAPEPRRYAIPVAVRDVQDAAGAGEAFAAGLLRALAYRWLPPRAVMAAHHAAGAALATSGPLLTPAPLRSRVPARPSPQAQPSA